MTTGWAGWDEQFDAGCPVVFGLGVDREIHRSRGTMAGVRIVCSPSESDSLNHGRTTCPAMSMITYPTESTACASGLVLCP